MNLGDYFTNFRRDPSVDVPHPLTDYSSSVFTQSTKAPKLSFVVEQGLRDPKLSEAPLSLCAHQLSQHFYLSKGSIL